MKLDPFQAILRPHGFLRPLSTQVASPLRRYEQNESLFLTVRQGKRARDDDELASRAERFTDDSAVSSPGVGTMVAGTRVASDAICLGRKKGNSRAIRPARSTDCHVLIIGSWLSRV